MSNFDSLSREELIAIILDLRKQITSLEKENEELRSRLPGGGSGKVLPDWIRPSRARRGIKERKKRHKSFVRRRETPTEVAYHAVEACPDCGRALLGGWVHRRRQVIEIPVTAVRVVEHVVVARWCGVCGKRQAPRLDLSKETMGTHRVGVRLMSLVAYLHTVGRVPIRTIQRLLKLLYGLHLGVGELTEILHAVARRGERERAGLLEMIRGSPAANADETGWRQDGENGYIWSFSTPSVRYFVYNKSRSGEVAKEVLGEDFDGVVVSDFYCGYNALLGRHQRCWVHLLRDLHKLKEENPEDTEVESWADKVAAIYQRAKEFSSDREKVRWRQRIMFEERLQRLAEGYVKAEVPQRILAERIMRFLPELFTFVECPDVPSENNGAERSLRPAVIARKVSGGTRSRRGSETKMALMSLFGTWLAQDKDPMRACQQMLTCKAIP